MISVLNRRPENSHDRVPEECEQRQERKLQFGLVEIVVPAAELRAKTLELAQKIAAKSPLTLRIAKEAGEPLGVSIIGRGFEVTVAAPFDHPLSDGLRETARRCAEACPSGALALRTERACDFCVVPSLLPGR